MKKKPVLVNALLLTVLLLGPVYGMIIYAVELVHRRDFERIEREFYVCDELHESQLRVIINSYEEQSLEQIGRLYDAYTRDESFAMLDELDKEQSQRIEKLIRLCPMNYAPQLAACIRRYELRQRAAYVAETPLLFRCIRRGMANYMLHLDRQ